MNVTIGTRVTEPQDFYLKEISGLTRTAIDLTNAVSVTLYLKSHTTGTVTSYATTGSKLSIHDADDGIVRFSPDDDDLALSDEAYDAYFMVVDQTSKNIRFPSTGVFVIDVIDSFESS